jgi:hypothetical protein
MVTRTRTPAKFPLGKHPSGQFCKRIKGKLIYFGKVSDPQAALNKYLAEKDYWQAGKSPPAKYTTVADILDAYLGMKDQDREQGDIKQLLWAGRTQLTF